MSKVQHDYSKVPGFEYMGRADWKLGNQQFLISAPAYLMTSDATIADRGTFSSGDTKIDAKMAKAPEKGWRTILEMHEIWKYKGTIQLINYTDDLPDIHAIIQQYFTDLQEYVDYHKGGNASLRVADNATFSRLMSFAKELDAFAKDVFEMAIEQRLTNEGPRIDRLDEVMPLPIGVVKEETARLSDYNSITNRIDYSMLNKRKRY